MVVIIKNTYSYNEECADNCWCYRFTPEETALIRAAIKEDKKKKSFFYKLKKWLKRGKENGK